MTVKIRVIRPSSREKNDLLKSRFSELAKDGFDVLYEDLPPNPDWQYVSATDDLRANALQHALMETDTSAVLCARGGYGASDLLPLIDWNRLGAARHKFLIGFSDISALHSGLFTKLGWPGIHAPMPATDLWGQKSDYRDIEMLKIIIKSIGSRKAISQSLNLEGPAISTTGILFGGCFSVLTNLIGTPYFPKSLEGKILFIEDTDEHPGRLMRALNQWLQCGALGGVRALVIGHLRNLGENIPDSADFIYREFKRRLPIPTFRCVEFGHTSPNLPLMIGARAIIEQGQLTWTYDRSSVV